MRSSPWPDGRRGRRRAATPHWRCWRDSARCRAERPLPRSPGRRRTRSTTAPTSPSAPSRDGARMTRSRRPAHGLQRPHRARRSGRDRRAALPRLQADRGTPQQCETSNREARLAAPRQESQRQGPIALRTAGHAPWTRQTHHGSDTVHPAPGPAAARSRPLRQQTGDPGRTTRWPVARRAARPLRSPQTREGSRRSTAMPTVHGLASKASEPQRRQWRTRTPSPTRPTQRYRRFNAPHRSPRKQRRRPTSARRTSRVRTTARTLEQRMTVTAVDSLSSIALTDDVAMRV